MRGVSQVEMPVPKRKHRIYHMRDDACRVPILVDQIGDATSEFLMTVEHLNLRDVSGRLELHAAISSTYSVRYL